ncbi:MAG: hypothetical protein AAFY71_04735 [Bacteroidota bacterium]
MSKRPSHLRPIMIISLILSAVVLFSSWDNKWLYLIFTLGWGALFGLFHQLSKKGSTIGFLATFIFISLLAGGLIRYFSTSPMVSLMLSGIEFFNLGMAGMLILGLMQVAQGIVLKHRGDMLAGVMIILSMVFLLSQWGWLRTYSFPKPKGPLEVGSTSVEVNIGEEAFTKKKGDRRKLMVQLWYPAEGAKQFPLEPFKGLDRIQTNSRFKAPVARRGKYPIILYSAGAGGSRYDNMTQFEELASHGYLIMSIEHPFLNDVIYEDGRRIPAYSMDSLEREGTIDEYVREVIHGIRVKDLIALKNQLIAGAIPLSKSLKDHIDVHSIGVMGWSIGGSAAIEACLKDEDIHVAANLDGWDWMGKMDSVHGTKTLLYLKSDISDLQSWKVFGTGMSLSLIHKRDSLQKQHEAFLVSDNKLDVYSYRFTQAYHSNFRDHGLLRVSRLGEVSPERCNQQVSRMLLTFFDRYLKRKNVVLPETSDEEITIELRPS